MPLELVGVGVERIQLLVPEFDEAVDGRLIDKGAERVRYDVQIKLGRL